MMQHYMKANHKALEAMLAVKHAADSIPKDLKALIELRISQINGCAYCIDLHSREANAVGVSDAKRDALASDRGAPDYTDAEMAALDWAEAVTRVADGIDRNAHHTKLAAHFNDREIADLTYIVAAMNALNRMAIAYGDKPLRP